MKLNTQKEAVQPEGNSFNHTSIIPEPPYSNKYQVMLSQDTYADKPNKADRKLYKILNDTIDQSKPVELTLSELMDEISKGRVWKNGIHAKELLTKSDFETLREYRKDPSFNQKKKQLEAKKKTVLQHTTLAVLDVDDVLGKTDPFHVMTATGAVGLYHSYSHEEQTKSGIKMNRYRLLYDLNEPVKSKSELELIQEKLKARVTQLYPILLTPTFDGKSNGIDNLNRLIFGTNKETFINPQYRTVDVTSWKEEYKKEEAFKKLTQTRRFDRVQEISEQELINMADHLGDLNGQLTYEEWTTLAVGLWNTAQEQAIPDDTIIDVLGKLDGYQQSDKGYQSFKRPLNANNNMATVGTLIKLATDSGYKRSFVRYQQAEAEQPLKMPVTTVPIDKYIPSAEMLGILNHRAKKHLVLSDTNTGKTRASIEASREYLQQHTDCVIYLALPTKALAEQVSSEYQTGAAVQGSINIRKAVNTAIYNGTRLLVGTYDKAPLIHKHLNGLELIIIADEVHKEVSDYQYRYQAIRGLFNLIEQDTVIKFVGLTGTAGEIDKTSYNQLTRFELKKPKILADDLTFIEYHKATDYDHVTTSAIKKEVQQGNKVLCFINNKEMIKRIRQALKKQGIQASTVTAENRRSESYRTLMDKQTIDTDVILTTIVLADGINIENTKNYVCMIAPSSYKHAPFFNIDLIQQATNRFRKQYKRILIPLFVKADIYQAKTEGKQHERLSEAEYNLEQRYSFLLQHAEVTKTVIETEFSDCLNLYQPSVAEKLAGLFNPHTADHFNFVRAYDNQERKHAGLPFDATLQEQLEQLEADYLTIDLRAIRQQASKDKELYYSYFPYAFKKAITDVLSVGRVNTLTAFEYFKDTQTTDVREVLKEIEKAELKTNEDKRENLKLVLHELVFAKAKADVLETNRVNETKDVWQTLKLYMHPTQYSCLKSVIRFLEYDQAIHELERVRKKAQVYELEKQFKRMLDIQTFERTDKKSVTHLIYDEIKQLVDGANFYGKEELENTLNETAKAFKIRKRYSIAKKERLFKDVFSQFFVTKGSQQVKVNGKNARSLTYQPLSFEYMASIRELETEEIENQFYQYLYGR